MTTKPPVRTPPEEGSYRHRTRDRRALIVQRAVEQDPTDTEVAASVREGRPIDFEAAFPVPAPAVRSRTRPNQRTDENDDDGPTEEETLNRPPSGEEAVDLSEADVPPAPVAGQSPRQRLAEMARHGPSYLKEYKLRLVHRLIMRGLPLDVIANQLGGSVDTVRKLRKELCERLTAEANNFDMPVFFGKTDAFYSEIRSIAMRMADDTKNPANKRLEALRVALNAEQDRQRFYHVSGVFQQSPLRLKGSNADSARIDEAADVIDMLRAVMQGEEAVEAHFEEVDGDASDQDDVSLLG